MSAATTLTYAGHVRFLMVDQKSQGILWNAAAKQVQRECLSLVCAII